jgi:hypothetical protein
MEITGGCSKIKTSKDGFLLKGSAMKRWLLIPLLSMAVSLQSFAQASGVFRYERESILLSYEEFSQLTHAEQKTYVKRLRDMMIEVANAYPEMAEDMKARDSFYAQLWDLTVGTVDGAESARINTEAKAQFIRLAGDNIGEYLSQVEKVKTDKMTDAQRGELVSQYRQALCWAGSAAQWGHDIKDEKTRKELFTEVINPMKDRLEKAEAKVKKTAGSSSYEKADDYFKKAYSGQIPADDTHIIPEKLIPAGERLPSLTIKASNGSSVAEPTAVQAEEKKPTDKIRKDEKPVSATAAAPAPAVKPTKTEEPNKSEEPRKDVYYRCMYAGFVIKNNPCMAPPDLPWELKGLDQSQFICEKGTVMCNPFLFGFKATCDWSKANDEKSTQACYQGAKPFCVKPGGLYVTKNCGEISNSDAALEAAVHLIGTNPEAFNQYSNSFGDLCQRDLINFNSYEGQRNPKNIARTRADIKRTCESARARMTEIRQRYNLVKEKKSTGAPSAQSVNKDPVKTAK